MNFEYKIIKSKIKNMYIHIKDGKVFVKIPNNYSNKKADDFVKSKEKWILDKLLEYDKSSRKIKEYVSGERFKVLGDEYILDVKFGDKNKSIVNLNDGVIEVILSNKCKSGINDRVKELIDKMYLKIAEKSVYRFVNMWEDIIGICPSSVNFKKSKMAWGKCDFKGKITINPDLMMFDEDVINYVVLHEFCHLKYMNHSKFFWNMVGKYMPNYKEIKNKLKC